MAPSAAYCLAFLIYIHFGRNRDFMPCGILHVLTPIDIFGTNTTMELKAVCPKVRLILDGSIPMNLLTLFSEASVSAQS